MTQRTTNAQLKEALDALTHEHTQLRETFIQLQVQVRDLEAALGSSIRPAAPGNGAGDERVRPRSTYRTSTSRSFAGAENAKRYADFLVETGTLKQFISIARKQDRSGTFYVVEHPKL